MAGKRVLIVKLGAIGDVIMVIPAAHALYQTGAAIDWVCGSAVAPLLACYPWIRVISIDDRAILTGAGVKRLHTLAKLWRVLGGVEYDLVATLYYDARYKLLAFPIRAKRKLMPLMVQQGKQTHPHTSITAMNTCVSCSARKIPTAPASTAPLRPERLPACTLPERRTTVRVGIVPGGASNMLRQQTLRRWPVASYVHLVRELLARGYEVVLMGGPDDTWGQAQLH